MSRSRFHNKLSSKTHFELGPFPQFYSWPDSGILPVPATLDPRTGNEIALFLFDKTPFIYELARVRPFDLMLKTGLVRTDNGPLLFLLFYVPDPRQPGRPFAILDCHLNPLDPQSLQPWGQLDRQAYWHVVLVDQRPSVVDLFEFENVYELGDTLDQAASVCASLAAGNFDLAKREFCDNYTPEELYHM
jgi:hypothetical protein